MDQQRAQGGRGDGASKSEGRESKKRKERKGPTQERTEYTKKGQERKSRLKDKGLGLHYVQ